MNRYNSDEKQKQKPKQPKITLGYRYNNFYSQNQDPNLSTQNPALQPSQDPNLSPQNQATQAQLKKAADAQQLRNLFYVKSLHSRPLPPPETVSNSQLQPARSFRDAGKTSSQSR